MSPKNALTLSIGVLAVIAVWVTAEIITVPVWVVFIAWASFFFLGAGPRGLVQSLASNLTGIAIASLCLLVIQQAALGTWMTGVVVGVGSALMVAVSRLKLIATIPAIVLGFASTVGTSAVTGQMITYPHVQNPVLIVVTAMVLGAAFGYASDWLATKITTRTQTIEVTV
ncbi:DUF1097 domain-containing protein [Arthrobacter sp. AB6]|uniref:DUF1097 domain-containing protein n=1 Tax=Arthrobacter sp. AB6 TaxID=2962570 RepID=UPI0028820DCA|nr:DUF1097 domain-containing protein [Arthrobacter sp. AB6]MDT0196685.1 DUF1097 domain-containing protein [Arthrobacter sp. AB6]